MCFKVFCCVQGELPALIGPAVTKPATTVLPHSCPEGQFVCGTHGECVPLSQVCDFKNDCSDGADETNCGRLAFCCCNSINIIIQYQHFHTSFIQFQLFLTFPLHFPTHLSCSALLSVSFPLPSVKEKCDFEGGDTCSLKIVSLPFIPNHTFRWATDQGESIHSGQQYHRPVNDHTL